MVVVEARDAWRLLDRWRARRTLQWAAGAKTVNQLLTYLFARAGLILGTDSASSAIGSLTPAFTVHPGESGATAVRRLLAKVPDRVRMRSGRGAAMDPEASDGADYDDYGVAHALLSWAFRDAPSGVNRARVVGAGVFQEAFDFAEMDAAGELVLNVDDQGIASNADATARAGFELRAALLEAGGSEVSVRVNAGQELYDVVAVTAELAGWDAELRRVQGLRWRFGLRGTSWRWCWGRCRGAGCGARRRSQSPASSLSPLKKSAGANALMLASMAALSGSFILALLSRPLMSGLPGCWKT